MFLGEICSFATKPNHFSNCSVCYQTKPHHQLSALYGAKGQYPICSIKCLLTILEVTIVVLMWCIHVSCFIGTITAFYDPYPAGDCSQHPLRKHPCHHITSHRKKTFLQEIPLPSGFTHFHNKTSSHRYHHLPREKNTSSRKTYFPKKSNKFVCDAILFHF